MPRLGNNFPQSRRREWAQNQLTPGRVLYLFCEFTIPPKEKYLALVCRKPRPLLFAVNSSLTSFVEKRPDFRKCQVSLSTRDYDFLRHDSFLNCSEVIYSLQVGEIVDQLVADTTRTKGALNEITIQEITQVVRDARTISPIHKKLIERALGCAGSPASGEV